MVFHKEVIVASECIESERLLFFIEKIISEGNELAVVIEITEYCRHYIYLLCYTVSHSRKFAVMPVEYYRNAELSVCILVLLMDLFICMISRKHKNCIVEPWLF